MASIHREIAPDVEIYAVGTLYLNNENKWVDSLIIGVNWVIENGIDIITLSNQQISDKTRGVWMRK